MTRQSGSDTEMDPSSRRSLILAHHEDLESEDKERENMSQYTR